MAKIGQLAGDGSGHQVFAFTSSCLTTSGRTLKDTRNLGTSHSPVNMRLLPLLNDAAPAPHQHTQTHPPLPAAAASLHEAHAFQLLPYRWAPRLFPGSHCHEKCYSRYLSPHPWIQRHRYRYTEISRDVFYVWEWPYECTAQTGTAFSGKRTFQTLIAAAGFYSEVAGTTRSPCPAHGNARFTATPPTARLPLILGLRQTQCGVTAGQGKPPPPPPATVLLLGLPRTGRVAGPRPILWRGDPTKRLP